MPLHILGPGFSTFVRSVRLYCEEKRLAYSYGMSLRGQPIAWRDETHRAYHPFGKVPVLFHGDRHVFETNAIFRYLDAVFPGRSHSSDDLATRTEIDQWSSALTTSVDQLLVRNYLLLIAGPAPVERLGSSTLAEAETKVEATLELLDAQLGERSFLCAERYSVADALLTPMLDYLSRIPRASGWLEPWPRLGDYLDRMQARRSGQVVLVAP